MIAARCLASAHRMMFRSVGLSFYRASQQKLLKLQTETQHSKTAAENMRTAGQSPETDHHTRSVEVFDVRLVVSVLKQENATDICVIKVPQDLKYTDHIIIVSASSPRHLTALAEFLLKMFKFVRRSGDAHARLEGRDCDNWKCIDFGSLVIHLMLPETRETYELEKLWTLRSYDDQLRLIPPETLPTDFIYDLKLK